MAGWNLWHGCRKVSEGCRRCYVYRQDARWEQDASQVRRTAAFDLPVRRDRTGRYKIPPGQTVYTCFTSDFFIEEADAWRGEAWAMIRERSDCTFLMITKRIDRVAACLPADWGEGWPHVATSTLLLFTYSSIVSTSYISTPRIDIPISLGLTSKTAVMTKPLFSKLV